MSPKSLTPPTAGRKAATAQPSTEGLNPAVESGRGPSDSPTQRQDSLHDQMMDVIREAQRLGCYDAADWIKARWNMPRYHRMSEAAMKAALPNPDELT